MAVEEQRRGAPAPTAPDALRELLAYPLIEALTHRRSRRFSAGAAMPGGGLAYRSELPPQPLSELEEAVLAVSAAGANGFCLGDIPYQPGDVHEAGGGNVIATLVGRSGASADAIHGAALFVINDDATYLLKRPQDLSLPDVADLSAMAVDHRYEEVYRRLRIQVRDGRTTVPREVPFVFPFNKWSTNLAGTTYFLPVSDLTAMYLNVILSMFDEQMAVSIVDERAGFAPAGVGAFTRARGGRLHDDPDSGRVVPILGAETVIAEFLLAEQAFMGHTLSLVEQAMGLGGWTHFATASEVAWLQALGFRIGGQRVSQAMRAGPLKRLALRAAGKDRVIPVALGLTVDGADLIKPYCPPYYPTMEHAVRAFLEFKRQGIFEAPLDPAFRGTWRDGKAVQRQIPQYSAECVAATIAYCTYVYETYGRFPAYFGPLRTTLAHQAHHLDLAFYDRFYTAGAYGETQAQHEARWH